MGGAEARAWPVADPAVKRHAEHGDVGVRYRIDTRQAGEGGLPGVAGYQGGVHRPDGVASDDPRNRLGHVIAHPSFSSCTRQAGVWLQFVIKRRKHLDAIRALMHRWIWSR